MADVRAQVSYTELMQKFPQGVAYADSPDVKLWSNTRSCRASHYQARCCVQVTRRTREEDGRA